MREYKAIFICILICNVFVCPKSFGQTDYTYEKGKSFKNTNALSMTDTIDLTSISSPISYKKSIPGLKKDSSLWLDVWKCAFFC